MIKIIKFCTIYIVLFSNFIVCAQINIKLNIHNIETKKILVSIKLSDNEHDSLTIEFPTKIRGHYYPYDCGQFIQDFLVKDSCGHSVNYKKIHSNKYIVYNKRQNVNITYDVLTDWSALSSADKTLGNCISADFLLLNFHSIVGKMKPYTSSDYLIEISLPKHFFSSSSLKSYYTNDSIMFFYAHNYDELIDNPILYTLVEPKIKFIDNNTEYKIAINKQYDVDIDSLSSLITPIIKEIIKEFDGLNTVKYHFLILFDEIDNKQINNINAIEHKYNSVYYFNIGTLPISSNDLSHVFAHELLHTFSPIRFRSNIYDSVYIEESSRMSKHLWLYEGVIEYLTLKSLFQAGIYDSIDFLEKLIHNHNNSKELNVSLVQLSQSINKPEDIMYFYSKGSVCAFLMDLLINEQSNGNESLFSILKKQYENSSVFDEEELFKDLSILSSGVVDIVLDKYIIGSQLIPFQKEYLSKLGYKYSLKYENKVGYKFPFHIKENINNQELLVDGSFCPQLGNKEVLISKINNETANMGSYKKYVMNPSVNTELVIEKSNGGKVKIKPQAYFYIQPRITILKDENQLEKQKQLFNHILNKL